MTTPIQIDDPRLVDKILRRRRLAGADRYDEVWDGVYFVAPMANDEHQELTTDLSAVITFAIKFAGLGQVRHGVNVSDRVKGWKENYRVPDVAVRLNGGLAKIYKNHWVGGPDFVIEVVSQRDRSRQKLDFYAATGTREVLLVDREPWAPELYGLRDGRLVPMGVSSGDSPVTLTSNVVPLAFRLVEGEPSPKIEVTHRETGQTWRIDAIRETPA